MIRLPRSNAVTHLLPPGSVAHPLLAPPSGLPAKPRALVISEQSVRDTQWHGTMRGGGAMPGSIPGRAAGR